MGAVLIIFVVCMIGKDVTFAPFPYVLRGVAQSMCLGVGLFELLPYMSFSKLACYWPVLAYLLALLIAAPLSAFPVFVLLQVVSLASAVIFAIAYFESPRRDRQVSLRQFVLCIVLTYWVVAMASLAFSRIQPSLTYESMFAGNESLNEIRFRGLFSKSGAMGAASGLLVGLAAIAAKRWQTKLLLVAPGVLCLVLTQSRSYWIATFVSGWIAAWIYYPQLRKWIWASIGAVVLTAMGFIAFNVSVDTSGIHTFARLDSVTNLTGRTELWQSAYKGWSEKPWLGYGFTLGGIGLDGDRPIAPDADPTQFSRQTLHNGYIQSLMDAGVIGFLFYALTMLMAIGGVLRNDSEKKYPEVLYALLFLSIANGGESVVYSGSVFQSLAFWVFAVFAMGIARPARAKQGAAQRDTPAMKPAVALRPPNLMR
jgi:O-antigen ligase